MRIELDETELISTSGLAVKVNIGEIEFEGIVYEMDMIGGKTPSLRNVETNKELILDWRIILYIAIELGINKPDVSTDESTQ